MPTGIYERPPIVADRLRWLEPHIGGFRPWLVRRGYRAVTIVEIVRLLSIWAEWADTAGFDLSSIEAGLAASAAVFRSGKTSRAPYGAAKLFIAWLRVTDVLPPETRAASPEETWPLLAAYSGWMREQRGLAESTLALRQPVIVNLLETLGGDPAAYTAKAVRRFVLERAAPHGCQSAFKVDPPSACNIDPLGSLVGTPGGDARSPYVAQRIAGGRAEEGRVRHDS